MPLYAGLDRGDTPDPRKRKSTREIYTVCIVAVEVSREGIHQITTRIKHECGLPARSEFRGHDLPEEIQLRFLEAFVPLGLFVGAILYEKHSEPQQSWDQWSDPSEFQVSSALNLLERFFAVYELKQLFCDEDVKGKGEQKKFETAIQRLHGKAHPGASFKARHKPSKNSEYIQLSDVVAYGLSRLERGLVEDAELRGVLKTIRSGPQNVIDGPRSWTI